MRRQAFFCAVCMLSWCIFEFSPGASVHLHCTKACLLIQVFTRRCECGWLLSKFDSSVIDRWHAQIKPTSLPMTEGTGDYCDNSLGKWKSGGWKWLKTIKMEMISYQPGTCFHQMWTILKHSQSAAADMTSGARGEEFPPVCSSVADLMLFHCVVPESEFMFSNHWHVLGQSNVTVVQIFLICIVMHCWQCCNHLCIFVEIVQIYNMLLVLISPCIHCDDVEGIYVNQLSLILKMIC